MSRPFTLSRELCAAVAPLPIPLAEHLFGYWLDKHTDDELDAQSQCLAEIAEKRQHVYLYMDSFVRNLEKASPHHLRFSTQWIRGVMGRYTPNKQEVPAKTFNHWVSSGFIRNTKKGQPTPESAAALILLRMLIEGKKLLPHSMSRDEPAWWCYAQADPQSAPYLVPIPDIQHLPPQTLLWTPWPGAAWDPGWYLISDSVTGSYYGAIRFAGIQSVRGQLFYTISMDQVMNWEPTAAKMYRSGPFVSDEKQALIRLVLVHLAGERLESC